MSLIIFRAVKSYHLILGSRWRVFALLRTSLPKFWDRAGSKPVWPVLSQPSHGIIFSHEIYPHPSLSLFQLISTKCSKVFPQIIKTLHLLITSREFSQKIRTSRFFQTLIFNNIQGGWF